jgi:FemAB-related protein (PEP-CTERM system-associated)
MKLLDMPSIELAGETHALEWNAYLTTHPEATGYHGWQWRRVFERGLGHTCHYFVARSNAAVVGVLPLVEVTSWMFGRALSSLPYVNYGGVLADTQSIAARLVEHAGELASNRGLSYVLLRHRRRCLPQLPARAHKVSMVLALERDSARMWEAFDRKVRNQVRKAEKSGLRVETGGEALLDDFYTVFARNMRDLGTPVYSRKLFVEILACEPENARLHVVRLDSRPIAAALSYVYGNTMEVPSASSLREHRALCPNHLLYWAMMQSAIAQGSTRFDFGRSTPGDGTYHFKEQWGAVAQSLYWEYELRNGTSMPDEDRHNPRFQARIEAWKRIPLPLTLMLGPRIARCVP